MGNYFDDVVLTLTVAGGGTATDISCDVTAATLTPDTPEEQRSRLCGKKTVTGQTTWTLDLEYDQNWSAGEVGPPAVGPGLSWFLQQNAGSLADFSIVWALEDTEATGQVRIKPGPYGGTAGEIAEATVTLGVDGQPTFGPITATLDATGGDDDQADDDVDVDAAVAYDKAAA